MAGGLRPISQSTLSTERRFFRAKYVVTNTTMEIGKPDIRHVQEHAFELFGHKNLKPRHITSGLAVAAVGLTGYVLEKKYGLVSRVLGRGSVIYEVLFPATSSADFEKLTSNDTLENELKQVFNDLENSLKELGYEDLLANLNADELAKLKELHLQSFKLIELEMVEELLISELEVTASQAPRAPKSLRVDQYAPSPSTTILVYYQPPDEAVDHFVICVRNVAGSKESTIEKISTEEFAVVNGLHPSQSYFVWVQSEKNGVRSKKEMLSKPIETARFDPPLYRRFDDGNVAGTETESIITADMYGGAREGDGEEAGPEPEQPLTELLNTDLPRELRKIFPTSFSDLKLKRLLCKLEELGVAEAKDLKYCSNKEVMELLREALKPIELLKLVDYATDSVSSEERQKNSHLNMHIEKFIGGSLVANSKFNGGSTLNSSTTGLSVACEAGHSQVNYDR